MTARARTALLPMCALGLAVSALSACPDGMSTGGDAGTEVRWEEAFDASSAGSISSVWGSGPDDVWMVGGDEENAIIHHYDGSEWSKVEGLPDVPLLVWVYGFGPDDVYTVGTGGGAMHYDGDEWTVLDTGTEEDLWGVFGFAPDDLWVVGGDTSEGSPLLLHYDGESFTPYELPESENPDGARSLFKIWGIGDRLFAVGQRGLILGYEDGEWVRHPAGAQADDDFVSLWGTSEDRIVAVGGRSNARIATWDGESWSTVAPSGVGGLNAVFMEDPDRALVGGVWGETAWFDPDTETLEFEDVESFVDIHAIWGDGAGRHYAVGGTFLEPHRGKALVRLAD